VTARPFAAQAAIPTNYRKGNIMELIESSVTLADVAKVLKSTPTKVEADCHELSLFVGCNWAGKPAISVTDAAGAARRDADHAAAHGHWRAAGEAWELQREQVRQQAYTDHFDTARRRGVGDPAASSEAAQVASAAVEGFEKSTPAPVFDDAGSSRVAQMKARVKESVLR